MKIKGTNKNMQCRGVQFEIGKEYITYAKNLTIDDLCTDKVFHYCDNLRSVNTFYPVDRNNRYFEIEVLGEEVTDGVKCGSDHIKFIREIKGEELDKLCGRVNGNTGVFNSGNLNSGNLNSGNRNSGNWNSGNWNSGNFNSCDFSSGVFCNEPEESIRIFNKPSGMTHKEFFNSKYFRALYSVPLKLTAWIEDDAKTEGGYLLTRTYKEACAIWWDELTDKNKEIIKSMPNFDADVFEDITGIEVE